MFLKKLPSTETLCQPASLLHLLVLSFNGLSRIAYAYEAAAVYLQKRWRLFCVKLNAQKHVLKYCN